MWREKSNKRKILFYTKNYIIWDVNVDDIVILKLVKTKANYRYLVGYLDEAIRPLVLIILKLSGYVKTFEIKDRDKDEKNELMYCNIDDEKLLEKYKAIRTKIEDIELNALPIFDDRYIKTKLRTYGDNVYTNFCKMCQNMI